MTPETVFDGRHLRAVLLPGTRDRLIVTFDYRMLGKSDFTATAHSSNFARSGYSQLSIKSRGNDWFINPDTKALETTLCGVGARFGHVGLIGYSMGGYGALRYAQALGARTAVLISPQVSIDPDRVPFDRRYRAEGRGFDPELGDLGPRAVPHLAGLVLIDPFVRPDLRHARMIGALFPGLELVRLPFGGHPAVRVLRGAGKSWTIHREAASLSPNPRLIRKEHRAGRHGSAGYWIRLAARADARHPARAAEARTRAASLAPQRGDTEADGG